MTKQEETKQDLELIAKIKSTDLDWTKSADTPYPYFNAKMKGINLSIQLNAAMVTLRLQRGEKIEFVCRHVVADDLVCRALLGLKIHAQERTEKANERVLVKELLMDSPPTVTSQSVTAPVQDTSFLDYDRRG